jgi:hypothetical protein
MEDMACSMVSFQYDTLCIAKVCSLCLTLKRGHVKDNGR